MIDKEILELSDDLTNLGLNMLAHFGELNDKHGIKVGHLLNLIGGIIKSEEDLLEFENFTEFFSAKKIMDNVNPAHLFIAKQIGDMPDSKELVEEMMSIFTGKDNVEEKPANKNKRTKKSKVVEEPVLIQNALRCKVCNKIILSSSVHDYVKCGCENEAMVDGGLDYFKRGGVNMEMLEDLSLNSNSTSEEFYNKLVWGNRGIDGKQPLEYKLINSLETDHIQAILKNVSKIGKYHKKVMLEVLKKRNIK